jgi:drug/metabolite transporter (DMT)-like permease
MIVSSRLRDWALLLFCNLIWASQFVMVKLVQEQMGPAFAAFFPMTIATVLLIPLVRPQGLWPRPRDWVHFVLLGVLGQVVAQLFITWGVRLSLASNAALITLALPVMTALMAYLILGERMSRIRWISFALALAGVTTCSGIDWRELNLTDTRFLLGNLMIFASINGSAFYNTYSKRILKTYSPLAVLLYSYYAVFAFMLPVTLRTEPGSFQRLTTFTPKVWLGLAVLALFQYFLSMVIFLNVLTRLDATQAGLCNYLIPVFGVILAWLVLDERLTPAMLGGGALVLTSTLLITTYESRHPSGR